MSKKVLIIATSPRKDGNSNRLAQEFEKGAKEAGNTTELVYLYDKTISFCKGCLACQKTHQCIIKDDANEIVEKMKHSDVIVWATPIYYYEMSGQMKTMIDRANPIFGSEYKFKDIYLIATAADSGEYSMDGAIKGLQGWIDCFAGTSIKGVIKGLGLEGIGAVENNPILHQAYNMGRTV